MNNEIKDVYKKASVATICTALFKKGLKNQFIQGIFPLNKKISKMLGLAFTVRYIPAREDLNSIDVFKDPNHPQRVAVEECPKNYVMVFDSRKNPRAASPIYPDTKISEFSFAEFRSVSYTHLTLPTTMLV